MRKTSIPNKLIHKLQAHSREPKDQRVCEENKLFELEKMKYFMVKGSTLKGCRRTVTLRIDPNFVTSILHYIKVLVL